MPLAWAGTPQKWLAPAFVGILAVGAWLASGVAAGDVALHLLYLLLVGFGPGVALVARLSGSRDVLIVLGVGCAAGMALEVLGVVVTANLGVRWLAPAIPFLAAATAWWLTRGASACSWQSPSPAKGVGIAVSVSVGIVILLCLGWLLPSIPLPGTTAGVVVSYDYDWLFRLGIAADALHHWPPANPSVAGQDLSYHTWALVRQAGEARVTGIDLPVVAFRLDVTTRAIALALAVGALARTAGARALGVALAPLLLLGAGELDLHPNLDFPFRGTLLQYLATDPSTSLGLTMFAAAATALWHAAENPRHYGGLVVLALLLFGAIGAKVPAVPVLFGGAVLLCSWHLLINRRLMRGMGLTSVLSAVVIGLGVAFLYSEDTSNASFTLSPLAAIERMDLIDAIRSSGSGGVIPGYHAVPDPLLTGILGFVGIIGLAGATFSGLALRRRRDRNDDRVGDLDGWLVALLVSAALPFLLLLSMGGNEVYFVHYALLAGSVLSAVRFEHYAWRPSGRARRWGLVAAAAGAMGLGLVAAAWISSRGPEPTLSIRPTLIAIGLVGALAWGLNRVIRGRGTVGPLLCAAILGLGLLDAPLDTVPRSIDAARQGASYYDTGGRGLTNELFAGLRWIREQTPDTTVIAVNNHFVDDAGRDPRAFQYSAFSERRVYLQSWRYASARPVEVFHPYPRLERLNAAAFAGDTNALRQLRRAGVRYLLLDRRYGGEEGLARSARTVFSNRSVTIFALGPP